MLFSTTYVSTDIEDFQNSLSYFFNELSTNLHQNFSEAMFPEFVRPKLYKYGNVALGHKKFVSVFQDIFNLYVSNGFTDAHRTQLINDFIESNRIDDICNDSTINPIHYDDLDTDVKVVVFKLNTFYDQYFNDLNNRDNHFKEFCYENGKICPVCSLDTLYQYDHFFPKGSINPIYPFSSVNPRNLIPICQKCNGSKSSKIILYSDNNRNNARLNVFSPYSSLETWAYLNLTISNLVRPTVGTPGTWQVSFTLKENQLTADQIRKINQWRTFFDIEERFSREIEKCIKIWIQEFLIKRKNFDEMVNDTGPNRFNIRRINGILLQNLLFKYIRDNQELKDFFVATESTAQDPSELLDYQDNGFAD